MVMQSTPLAGLGSVLLIVAVLAFIGGLALSNTDVLNPNTSQSTARSMDAETEYNREKAQIDLRTYQSVQESWAAAQHAQILGAQAEELAHAKQNREMIGLLQMVLILGGGCALVVLSTAGGYFLVEAGLSRRAARRRDQLDARDDLWRDPVWRREQVRLARAAEMAERRRNNGHLPAALPEATMQSPAPTASSLSQRSNGPDPRPGSPVGTAASIRTGGAHRP